MLPAGLTHLGPIFINRLQTTHLLSETNPGRAITVNLNGPAFFH
jgi:hypothetical protein